MKTGEINDKLFRFARVTQNKISSKRPTLFGALKKRELENHFQLKNRSRKIVGLFGFNELLNKIGGFRLLLWLSFTKFFNAKLRQKAGSLNTFDIIVIISRNGQTF